MLELSMGSAVREDMPADTSKVGELTNRNKMVRAAVVHRAFLLQPQRSIITAGAGGVLPSSGSRDTGQAAEAAESFAIRSLVKASAVIMSALRQQQRPVIHVSFDEARVYKRNTMQVICCTGVQLFMAPTQTVADFISNTSISDEAKVTQLANAASAKVALPIAVAKRLEQVERPEGALQQPSAIKVRSSGLVTRKAPTVQTYQSLCNALYQLIGFSFDLCRSDAPLMPVKKHEVRLEAPNGWKYVENTVTGAGLFPKSFRIGCLPRGGRKVSCVLFVRGVCRVVR
jgi:hypothetical protein